MNSFKLEDNYKNKKSDKNTKKSKKYMYLLFIILSIFIFGGIIYYFLYYTNYVSKIDDKKEYVYTTMKRKNTYQEGKYDEIPKININTDEIRKINSTIIDNYEEVSKQKEYDYYYQFSKSKNILSLLVAYAYYESDTDGEPLRNFETINIDLKTGTILSDDETLKKYHLAKNKVNDYLEAKFTEFYNGLIRSKYFTEKQCSYECFMKNRGISNNYLNGVNFYIDNGTLIAYKYFYTVSSYEEQYYFNSNDYKFIIKE